MPLANKSVVNKINKAFLTKLVQNGPDLWPGAKMLEKQNGETITTMEIFLNKFSYNVTVDLKTQIDIFLLFWNL